MAKIFLSHSSVDNASALALGRWLEENGWDDFFLDITPVRGLAPGERWQAALKAAADRCEAVLFLISSAWRDSRWCLAEFLLAKQLGKTIFGVVIESMPLDSLPKEMTAEWQLCDLANGPDRQCFHVSQGAIVSETEVSFSEAGLDRLRIGLKKAGLDPATFPWPPPNDLERLPYRGLKPLEAEDAAIFFGREADIIRGLDVLRGLRERGLERLFVILGASGSGKSSFLRAGLWPRLRRDDRHFIPLPVIRPGLAALTGSTGLYASLELAFRERRRPKDRAEIRKTLQAPNGLRDMLVELQRLAWTGLGQDAALPSIVVNIDQGEELFGSQGQQEAEAFLTLLGDVLATASCPEPAMGTPLPAVLAIVAIRSDSYEHLQSTPKLDQVKMSPFDLRPLSRSEYKAVIEGPAARTTKAGRKLDIEPALTERLLHDAEGADALPLLAYVVERLLIEHGADGKLELVEYEAMGGISGSIDVAIEAVFADPDRAPRIPADAQTRDARLRCGFIPWLARVDPETGRRHRRVAPWEKIPLASQPLIERLIEARLVTRDRRSSESGHSGCIIVEVAHEALLRQWPLLSRWLAFDAVDLQRVEVVKRAARAWHNHGRNPDWLDHKTQRLEAAEALRQRQDFWVLIGAQGEAYLADCRLAQDRSARRQRIAKWGFRFATVILAILSSLLMWLAYESDRHEKEARANEQEALGKAQEALGHKIQFDFQKNFARSRQLAMQANIFRESRLDLALLLAVQAYRLQPTNEATEALTAALTHSPALSTIFHGHAGPVRSVAFSQDGAVLASAGDHGVVRLWNVQQRELFGDQPSGHTASVRAVAFSPVKDTLAFTDVNGVIHLWDVAKQGSIGELKGHKAAVWSVAFSPKENWLASGGSDGTVRLWNLNQPNDRPAVRYYTGSVQAVAFGPEGRQLAYGGEDGTVRLWDLTGERPTILLKGHEGPVWSVAFSPRARVLASAGADGTVRLWDTNQPRMKSRVLSNLDSSVQAVAFSHDGKILASAGLDRAIRLWDVEKRKPIGTPLTGHTFSVRSLAFSHRGHLLASASVDGTVRLWEIETEQALHRPLTSEAGSIWSIALDAKGKVLASAGADGTIRLWNLEHEKKLGDLRGHTDGVWSLAFRPSEQILASAGDDHTIRLWDVEGMKPKGKPLTGHQSLVASLTFSPDGKILASAGDDNLIRLWDVERENLLGLLPGHEGPVWALAFSSQMHEPLLASGGLDRTVRLWPIDKRSGLPGGSITLGAHGSLVSSVAFSLDGETLASAGADGTVRLWDVGTRSARDVIHTGPVWSVAFHPTHPNILASLGLDHSVRLWNVARHGPLGVLHTGHSGPVWAIAFGRDGKIFASAGDDGTIRFTEDTVSLSDLSPDVLLADACRIANRDLTQEEWELYIGAKKYKKTCSDLSDLRQVL
ncbi:hypothetical protein YTPLAS18_05370 [Nitrospira sp.]|nr:hypothetical protein YTPLAS18_05370 [Nitrospira sp.]